jgi:hypothetical protein
MGKRKIKSSLSGRWRIVSMTEWDEDYLDEEVPAYIKFGDNRLGSFQFGYVQGDIDYRTTERDGKLAVEFSWEGGDAADGTPLTGRGWAVLDGTNLNGMFYIHQGDESGFEATKP